MTLALRRVSFWLLLASGTLLVCVAILEIGARAVLWWTEGRLVSLEEIREELGSVPEAAFLPAVAARAGPVGQTELHPYLGYSLRSPWGLTEPRPAAGRSPGTVRVAVFGGSVADRLVYSSGDLLRAELEKLPALAGQRVEILNMAVGGYKQPQQLLELVLFTSLGAEYDIVVELDGFNDLVLPITENIPTGIAPFLPRSWNLYAAHALTAGAVLKAGELAARRNQLALLRDVSATPVLRISAAWLLGARAVHRWLRRGFVRAEVELVERVRPEAEERGEGLPVAYVDPLDAIEDVVGFWQQCSRLMANACRTMDAAYFHFLQPNQYLPGSKPMGAEERRVAILEAGDTHVIVARGYPLMARAGAALESEGIPFTDLTQLFRDATEPLYTDNCCHFGKAGSDRVALAIAREIGTRLARNPLPRRPRPQSSPGFQTGYPSAMVAGGGYHLVRQPDGGETVAGPDGQLFQIGSRRDWGKAMAEALSWGGVRVVGWARDPVAGARPARLVVFAGGDAVFAGSVGHRRVDVVQALGDPGLIESGFDFRLPRALLGPNPSRLRVVVLSATGEAGELLYHASGGPGPGLAVPPASR